MNDARSDRIARDKHNLKNGQNYACKHFGDFLRGQFWFQLFLLFFFNKDNVSLVREMFNQDKKDDDDKVEKESKDDPNINELDVRSLWEF